MRDVWLAVEVYLGAVRERLFDVAVDEVHDRVAVGEGFASGAGRHNHFRGVVVVYSLHFAVGQGSCLDDAFRTPRLFKVALVVLVAVVFVRFWVDCDFEDFCGRGWVLETIKHSLKGLGGKLRLFGCGEERSGRFGGQLLTGLLAEGRRVQVLEGRKSVGGSRVCLDVFVFEIVGFDGSGY